MATDLQDELRRLADDVPVAVPPRDLWIRGVRRQRRRRATALAIAAAVALIFSASGIVSFDVAQRMLQPAEPGPGRAAIPTRVDTPSPWTPSTGSTPIGPLAVIGEAPHHHNWFTKPYDLFGVSARTGTYRFLDLPRLADDGGVMGRAALSPDGRHVGYWTEGDPPKRQTGFEGTPVIGVASYDTVTGNVTSHTIRTQRGISPNSMIWVTPTVLLVDFGRLVRQGGTSIDDRTYLWTPGTGGFRRVGPLGGVGYDPAQAPSGFSARASTPGR